jgi:proteic killer suppression protein
MENARELYGVPGWRAHRLTGDRRETWSLMVSRNWRITFWVDTAESEICDLNYEDYH